jgi:hypothetical protein
MVRAEESYRNAILQICSELKNAAVLLSELMLSMRGALYLGFRNFLRHFPMFDVNMPSVVKIRRNRG